jgi:nicotinamide riboside transporter PnuC
MLFRYLFYICAFLSLITSFLGSFFVVNSYENEEINKTAMFVIGLINFYIFAYILL